MLTATYSPKQIKVEIVHVDSYPHRRGTVVTIRTLDGTRPFKAYTNGDGDTAMTDTCLTAKALLKDIQNTGLTADEAAALDNVQQSLNAARLERIDEVAQKQVRFESIVNALERTHKTTLTDSREMVAAYRLAAIALSKQVVAHLPR